MTLRMSCVEEIGMQLRSVRANEPDGHVDWPSATTRVTASKIVSLSRKDMRDARSRLPSSRAALCFPITAIPRRRGLAASKTLCVRKCEAVWWKRRGVPGRLRMPGWLVRPTAAVGIERLAWRRETSRGPVIRRAFATLQLFQTEPACAVSMAGLSYERPN